MFRIELLLSIQLVDGRGLLAAEALSAWLSPAGHSGQVGASVWENKLMTKVTAPWGQWPEPAKAGARRSILSSDIVVEGDVRSDGPVEVQGQVVGQVKAPDLLISSTGSVDGSAIALELKVQGKMSGAVEARHVSLLAGAVVLADVTHEQIAIEAGAQIEGQLKRAR